MIHAGFYEQVTRMTQKKPMVKKSYSPVGRKKAVSKQKSGKGSVVRGVYTPTTRRKTAPERSAGFSLSPERKLDIFGVILVLAGLISVLSLFAGRSNQVLSGWATIIKWMTGWGVLAVPIGLMAGGMYLILRRIEKLPRLPFEQLSGVVLLYLNLLAFLQLFGGGASDPYRLAEAGRGGGIIGGLLLYFLVKSLGDLGSFLALLAWLLIGLILSFDLSFAQIIDYVRAIITGARVPVDKIDQIFHSEQFAEPFNDEDLTPLDLDQGADEKIKADAPIASESIIPPTLSTHWTLPNLDEILEYGIPQAENEKLDLEKARIIEETLASLGAPGHVIEILTGPSVTMFGVEPDFVENRSGQTRVRVAKIVSLSHDLALALAATRIRIQAPVPGRNYVGIEVPNESTTIVRLRDIMDSPVYKRKKSPLRIPLGKDVSGTAIVSDLATMPHLLIAGSTGSGKSVCVNTILISLLLNNTPDDLKLILIDPKRVELTGYNGIPHLLAPVIVETERVVGALQWMMREMDTRYHKFSAAGARNLEDYNLRMQMRGERKLPLLVIIIDEMADLMMLAQNETEAAIARLAQMARATGLHLIVATQRPSTDIITGNIKANFPSRIAFAVASNTDSRVVLDQPGAEHLLGRGDMLFQAPDAPAPVRMQGGYVSDTEIQKVVDYWTNAAAVGTAAVVDGMDQQSLPAAITGEFQQSDLFGESNLKTSREDPLLAEVTDLVRREGRASISLLQKRLRIGYTRAARMIDNLEQKGVIGPQIANSQSREVLDYGPTAPPVDDGA
jgi:S-DNA-T family DNA segregation ATPase FtsK/SpoIIIE